MWSMWIVWECIVPKRVTFVRGALIAKSCIAQHNCPHQRLTCSALQHNVHTANCAEYKHTIVRAKIARLTWRPLGNKQVKIGRTQFVTKPRNHKRKPCHRREELCKNISTVYAKGVPRKIEELCGTQETTRRIFSISIIAPLGCSSLVVIKEKKLSCQPNTLLNSAAMCHFRLSPMGSNHM